MEITITLPEGYAFDTRIKHDDEWHKVTYFPDKMHNTALIAFLEKGMQRLANDKWSQESSGIKLANCRDFARDVNQGKEIETATPRSVSKPDDVTLAIKLAKEALKAIFKQATGKAKIADWQDKPAIAQFFKETSGTLAWNDDQVWAFVTKQKEDGKRDFLAEAQEQLARMDELTSEAEDLLGGLI